MISREVELIVREAFDFAHEKGYQYVTVEVLLLIVLKNPTIKKAMTDLEVDGQALAEEIEYFLNENAVYFSEEYAQQITQPTMGFNRIIESAAQQVKSSGREELFAKDLLVAILNDTQSYASYLLQSYGIEWLKLTDYFAHGAPVLFLETDSFDEKNSESSEENLLEELTTNLNERAKKGKIDPLIGRAFDIERVIQTLSRRRKNNPLLVGEAGVGKTAIVEGLAWLIEQGRVPDVIKGAKIYSLEVGAMLAGTMYRGEFEKRFNALIKALLDEPNAILFMDEIHMIVGAGSSTESKVDIANLLKPLLSSGKVRVIGSTTYKEYSQVFEKDRALVRRFQKVDVLEPSKEETIEILKGLKKYYESFHEVKYTPTALSAAVDLSVKYLPDRFLPDKAIDLIDEAGAKNRLLPNNERRKSIGVKEIESIVSKLARVPEQSISVSDKSQLKQLKTELKRNVFGQDKAIEHLNDVIILNRSGLGRDNKPIGSFLFAGPTGVGKTEVTVQLAKQLNLELLRFDMSEYSESHSVSRLIGSPPGYVGYDEGGLLTDQVAKHPHAVVLLDEIEKAHPTIYNLLLQIMDNASLTDSNGRKVDFRHIILVMTTNAGVRESAKNAIGFNPQDSSNNAMNEIKRHFSPEFRNRLDQIVWFNPLSEATILSITKKFITELEEQLKSKRVDLVIQDEVYRWLAEKGYDKTMGARPMARVIQERIKKPIANELLFGKLQKGGKVQVKLDDKSNLTFDYYKREKSLA